MNSNLSFRGFTLVEMLIVMAIVGALLSLVGPLAIDSLSKAQARSEVLTMRNWLHYQSQRAFITGNETIIRLQGKEVKLVVKDSLELIESMQFEHLFFQSQEFSFDKHGLTHTSQVTATVVQRDISIELNDWRGSQSHANNE